MPINEELVIDVADRIRDILDDYPAGPAILREILQNTDDAGGRVQRFILDSRQHSLEGLIDPLLKECQGPAIIAYNDSSFKPQDWIAIRSISNSSKKGDERSTGKFGLGFCTCYHITDYPHVLSGDKLLILDPHKNIKSSSGCIAFSTRRSATESDRGTYTAHFDAFKGILSPDSDTFDGTAIRLPLRLPSSNSRINPTPMSVEAVRDLFDNFIKNDLPEVMLFLKHITSIELSEISPDGTENVYASIQINNAEEIIAERSKSRGRSSRAETSHYELEVSMKYDPGSPNSTSFTRRWIITHYVDSFEIASDAMAKRLDRVENPDRVEAMMIADKLFPHVALAFPVPDATLSPSQTFFGRLFTLLPLPIITHFPLHIHATLSLTSSRQNLRNADETVMDPKGRLRVEWNRLIFTRFVPEAWVSLMKYLVSTAQDFDVFDIWPSSSIIRDGGHGYWPHLPYLVLKEAATRDVWPLWSRQPSRHQLARVVVTLNDNDPNLLPALVSCNVPVVVVPPNVLADISASEFKDTILSPATAVPFLRANSNTLSSLPSIAVKSICDYLVTAGDVNLIFNLPIIPNVQSAHTSLSPNLVYTIATESEASLFHVVDPNLLAGNCMSSSTSELLITRSEGKIHTLEPKDVVSYLKRRIGGLGGPKVTSVAVNPSVHQWLVEFWAWLDGWERRIELVKDEANWKAITGMHALPLRTADNQPAARIAGCLAIHPTLVQEEVLSTLVALEIPVLSSSFTNGPSIMLVSPPARDINFILRNLPKRKTLPLLNQATRRALKNFLVGHLSYLLLSTHSTSSILDSECRAALRSLPIFPLVPSGRRNSEDVAFDTAPEGSFFVARSVPVIPNIRRVHFIDYEQSMPLCQALGVEVLDEIAVLKIAMTRDVWTHLHSDVVPALIDRLIWRLPDFDGPMRRLFSGLEIIDVGDQGTRKSPNAVIDPASSLAGLFDPEDKVLPTGQFAIDEQGSYIQRLRYNNMLQTTLTDAMVAERIDKIVALSEEGEPERGRQKALRLLSLLDQRSKEQHFPTQSPELMNTLKQRAWIPSGDQVYKLSDLWDSRAKDALLCDWALHILPIEIRSPSLRISIGWEVVPFHVLRQQLLDVAGGCSDCQVNATEEISDRIKAVLKTLASRLRDRFCTDEEVRHLADDLGDAEWIPISEGRRIKARRTWLPTDSKSTHQQLGSRFFPVAESLLKENGMKELFTCMGIPERPSHDDLYASQLEILSELSQLGAEDDARNDLIRASIELALEICRNRSPEELRQLHLLVPTESGTLVESESVLYNDMEMDAQRLQDGTQFAHPLLSQASAKALGLQTYRGRQLSELESADDDNGFYIGEDITTRIKSVLLDYTIDHSFNEWVANAADAGATCMKLLVDESIFGGQDVIPTKSEFPPGPALVIYNNGLFSEEDFRGIGNIGQGGKTEQSNTIGRFGLGALSFYHFTELPMIISGNSVLLLDPSRQHLHLRRSRGIRITLDICQQRWPDQLKPLEEIFGFFAHRGYYNGLDRILPLKGWTTTSEALRNVLKLLQRFDHGTTNILDRVSLDDWAGFTARMRSWIRESSLYSLEEDPTFLDTLVGLPLFDGWQGRLACRFVPCSKLAMLPIREDIPNIAHFFPPNMIVTGKTSDLEAIFSRKSPTKLLSFAKFFSLLNIQRSQLPENLHASLRIIIKLVIDHYKGQYPNPLIPDEDGALKAPNELYDHRVEFYALQFKGRRDLFVHSEFRDLIEGMIPLGIRHTFDSTDLQAFIETVDEDANNGQDVMERAKWVWHYINESPLTMGGIDYEMIRAMRFIPCGRTQYSPDPTLTRYAPTHEMVVSPDDVHLNEHAPLLWTLRAAFDLAPSATLKRIYPEIGRPTAEHVVQHLINLSTHVATHELQSEALFHEIQHIYEWLRMNQKDVQQYLDLISPHPVWLNVDSMENPWTWCTANQLVFDLTRDTDRSFRAKQFLCDYRELLLAAGAQKRRYVTVDQQQPEASHSEKGLAGWRELRRREILFDIWFKPEGSVIGAHRGLLAALIPHFAQAFGGDSGNSLAIGSVEYPLPDATSAFAVRAVIDYVYTGIFSCTTPTKHDDVPLVLEHLLDLLKLSHLWGVSELEAQTVAAIFELKLVDEDNCDFVLQHAETYGSTTLAQYCIRTKELNGWI